MLSFKPSNSYIIQFGLSNARVLLAGLKRYVMMSVTVWVRRKGAVVITNQHKKKLVFYTQSFNSVSDVSLCRGEEGLSMLNRSSVRDQEMRQ
jgi:hypothetical protein